MESSLELHCNVKSCRQLLIQKAWVTGCHHVFCDSHGLNAFRNQSGQETAAKTCPICDSPINTDNYGVMRIDLDPPLELKSMMFLGLKPEIIFESASKAMDFWLHQAEYEKKLQAQSVSQIRDDVAKLGQSHKEALAKMQLDSNVLKRRLEESSAETKEMKNKYFALNTKFSEKCRSYQKLGAQYNLIQRKNTTSVPDQLGAESAAASEGFTAAMPPPSQPEPDENVQIPSTSADDSGSFFLDSQALNTSQYFDKLEALIDRDDTDASQLMFETSATDRDSFTSQKQRRLL